MPSVLIDADVLRECREALEETAWADWGKLTHLQFNQMRMSADAALSRLPDEGPEPFERLEDGSLFIASDDADSMGVCVRRYGAVIELQHRFANGYIKPPGFSLLLGPNARAVAHAILALVSAPQGTEARDADCNCAKKDRVDENPSQGS